MHYLITFRTYGTWLHGDERGSVDRMHNQVGEAFLESDPELQKYKQHLMKAPATFLNEECRCSVEKALCEVASYRGWTIHALNVLSNHVHVVVETDEAPDKAKPEKIINDFKAWATRHLREKKLISKDSIVWERHGSTRYLKTEESLYNACLYVVHYQDKMPGAGLE